MSTYATRDFFACRRFPYHPTSETAELDVQGTEAVPLLVEHKCNLVSGRNGSFHKLVAASKTPSQQMPLPKAELLLVIIALHALPPPRRVEATDQKGRSHNML
ncbi:unnamed protein product [Nippostrongylus brasiliensis]|uniref:Uncharacterized protein n=1 Tax=Nippostrongylus brasiliensis TaxID=27835 RepID=A0A0N4YNA8_NIPBR|nr:unnamed protein product [Nippostrongylus brasiliensis]